MGGCDGERSDWTPFKEHLVGPRRGDQYSVYERDDEFAESGVSHPSGYSQQRQQHRGKRAAYVRFLP